MKKKLLLMGVAAALVTTTIIGGTLAATTYRDSTGQETAGITTKNLSLSLTGNEESTYTKEAYQIGESLVPGQVISENRVISNNGDYAFFARVVLNKTWNERRMESAKEDSALYAKGLDSSDDNTVTASNINIIPGEGWNIFYEDEEQMILYYKNAVEPGGETTSFIKELAISSDAGNEYANQAILMDVNVQAVQADAGEEAIAAIWGVFPTISGNVITDIREN